MDVLELCSFTWLQTAKFKCIQYSTKNTYCQTNPRPVAKQGGVILLGWFLRAGVETRPYKVLFVKCQLVLGRAGGLPPPRANTVRPYDL